MWNFVNQLVIVMTIKDIGLHLGAIEVFLRRGNNVRIKEVKMIQCDSESVTAGFMRENV